MMMMKQNVWISLKLIFLFIPVLLAAQSSPPPKNATTTKYDISKDPVPPATGHIFSKKPSQTWLGANHVGKASACIQAAECAFNPRVPGQKFAYFQIDSSKATFKGAPYGFCFAYTTFPSTTELVDDKGYSVFFWHNTGGSDGVGTGPIRNPKTGAAGYEDEHGKYFDGLDPRGDRSGSKPP